MVALGGCDKLSRSSDQASPAGMSESAPAATAAAPLASAAAAGSAGIPAARTRSLVVTMSLGVVVDDIDLAVGKVRAAVERSGGFLANADASGAETQRSARLVLRVPTDQAHDVRGMLAALGRVESTSETAVDVTEEHADLQARLGNAKVQEQRILQIMKTDGGSIHDVLVIEAELSRVRGLVEQLEAQRLGLERRIDLATIHLELSLPRAASKEVVRAVDTPGESIAAAARGGLAAAYATLVYLAMALAASLPFVLPLLALTYGLFRAIRARRAHREAHAG